VTLDGFLIAHGSALILPLAVIEGPIVTIATGFLAAQGYFDWYWAFVLLVVGDLIGDILYYCLGHTSRTPLVGIGRRLGLRTEVSPELQHELKHHATKMLCLGKWTHSLGFLVLIGSGMLRISLAKFILVNLLAGLPKILVLFGFGYFAADYLPFFENHMFFATVVLCALGVAGIALILRRADGIWVGGR
jgi:membrane protein DedA with SNARE-associated domain